MSDEKVRQASLEHHDDEKHPNPTSASEIHGDGHNTKIVEVTNADLALALTAGPHLRATSLASIKLFLVLLVAFMGSMSNGFDGQVMSAVNGMQ